MIKRFLTILATSGIGVIAMGQQTPPVQPKTVDPPKLVPLVVPSLPAKNQVIANAPLSASEAVKVALAHFPQVAIARANVLAAHGQEIQTAAALNPTVSITGSGQLSTSIKAGNGLVVAAPSDVSGQIALNQLVFDFNRTRDMVRQSQALERASSKTYDQTLQDVALQTKQDFYSYVQAKQQSTVQEANVKSRQAQVDLTQATVNAGTGEPSDLVTAKTLLSQGVITWSQAQIAEKNALIKLATDMGIDPRTPINIEPSTETNVTLPTDLNTLVDLGLKQRPSILSGIESLRAAGYAVSVARKTDVPSISFQAGFQAEGRSNPLDTETGFVALTLNWTLIDGGLRAGSVITAKANQTVAAETLRQTSQSVVQDISNALVAVQATRQQIPVADAEVANAQEGIRLSEGRYRAGVTTFQEVITAQAALVQAQTDQVNAVAALAIALSSLDHAIGKWPVN